MKKRAFLYCAAAFGIFVLPYYVPNLQFTFSVSNESQFNNQAAVIALLAVLALATLLRIFDDRITATQGNPGRLAHQATPPAFDRLAQQVTPPAFDPLARWPLWLFLAINSAMLASLSWLTANRFAIRESAYFVNRLLHLQIGLTPYRDFEFAYGPGMLYLPWLVRALFGVSMHVAYLWTLWLFSAGGICVLWWLIEKSRADSQTKLLTFCLLATGPALGLDLGLQYTLLRFLPGFAALALAKSAMERFREQWYFAAPIQALLATAVLCISPEMAVAFVVALFGYLILVREWRVLGASIGMAIFLGLLLPPEMFQAFRSFAAGGNAFPILPSPYVLLYAGTVLAVIPSILAETAKRVSFAPFGINLTAAFAINAVAMLPGALGRADPGHVLYYGIGVFLLAMLRGGVRSKRRSAYFAVAAAVFLSSIVVGFLANGPIVREAFDLRIAEWMEAHPRLVDTSGNVAWNKAKLDLHDFEQENLQGQIADLLPLAPICVAEDTEAAGLLAQHRALQGLYFESYTNVTTVPLLKSMVANIENCHYIIVGQRGNASSALDLRVLLMFPWLSPKAINADFNSEIWQAIKKLLSTEYVAVKRLDPRHVLLERRVH